MYINQEPRGFNYATSDTSKYIFSTSDLLTDDAPVFDHKPNGGWRDDHDLVGEQSETKPDAVSQSLIRAESDGDTVAARDPSVWKSEEIQKLALKKERIEEETYRFVRTGGSHPLHYSRDQLAIRYGVSESRIECWRESMDFPAPESALMSEHGELWARWRVRVWERRHSKRRNDWPWDDPAHLQEAAMRPRPRNICDHFPNVRVTPKPLPRSSGKVPLKPREPLLAADRERVLIERWQTQQDPVALDELVRAFEPLARSIAWKNTGYGERLEDMVSAGNLGIMRALQSFDPSKGFRFATYASDWIRALIQETVKKSGTGKRRGSKLVKERPLRSLSDPLGDDLSGDSLGDQCFAGIFDPDPDWVDIDRANKREELRMRAASVLKGRDHRIIQSRYLSDARAPLSVLAKEFGISSERVRQIEQAAIAKLKKALVRP